jgi:hypothetical protein
VNTTFLTLRQALLPTLLGVALPVAPADKNRTLCMSYDSHEDKLETPIELSQALLWEEFLLHAGCQLPTMELPTMVSGVSACLPDFAQFKRPDLALRIIRHRTVKGSSAGLRFLDSLLIPALNPQGSRCSVPVSQTFDRALCGDLLLSVDVPPSARELAEALGVVVSESVQLCVQALRSLTIQQVRDSTRYTEWLSRLLRHREQLLEEMKSSDFVRDLLKSLKLFLPETVSPVSDVLASDEKAALQINRTGGFYSLADIFFLPGDSQQFSAAILQVCLHSEKQVISIWRNLDYFSFLPLFLQLGCSTFPSPEVICSSLRCLARDKSSFSRSKQLTPACVEKFQCLYMFLDVILYNEMMVAQQTREGKIKIPALVQSQCLPRAPSKPTQLTKLMQPPAEDLARLSEFLDNRAVLAQKLQAQKYRLEFPLITHHEELAENDQGSAGRLPKAALEPLLIQSYGARSELRPLLHPMLARCPYICACLGVELLEATCCVKWSTREPANLETYESDLTEMFRRTTGLPDLEVVVSLYTSCYLMWDHAHPMDAKSVDPKDLQNVKTVALNSKNLFVVFGDTCCLCFPFPKDETLEARFSTRIAIARAALARILHVRCGKGAEEAKELARSEVLTAVNRRQLKLKEGAQWSKKSRRGYENFLHLYNMRDVIFPESDGIYSFDITPPRDQQDLDSGLEEDDPPINDGTPVPYRALINRVKNMFEPVLLSDVIITGTAGQFSCSATTLRVGHSVVISGAFGSTSLIAGYTTGSVYTISATNGITTFTLADGSIALVTSCGTPTGLTFTSFFEVPDLQKVFVDLKQSPKVRIVDGSIQLRNGFNAELFFHCWLEKTFRSYDPMKHWRSSTCREVFPGARLQRQINDALGYDFVIEDDEQLIIKNQCATIQCRIKVKGVSGAWNGEIFVSACEMEQKDLARAEPSTAYIVAVVEHADDATLQRTRLRALINWSANENVLKLQPAGFKAQWNKTDFAPTHTDNPKTPTLETRDGKAPINDNFYEKSTPPSRRQDAQQTGKFYQRASGPQASLSSVSGSAQTYPVHNSSRLDRPRRKYQDSKSETYVPQQARGDAHRLKSPSLSRSDNWRR